MTTPSILTNKYPLVNSLSQALDSYEKSCKALNDAHTDPNVEMKDAFSRMEDYFCKGCFYIDIDEKSGRFVATKQKQKTLHQVGEIFREKFERAFRDEIAQNSTHEEMRALAGQSLLISKRCKMLLNDVGNEIFEEFLPRAEFQLFNVVFRLFSVVVRVGSVIFHLLLSEKAAESFRNSMESGFLSLCARLRRVSFTANYVLNVDGIDVIQQAIEEASANLMPGDESRDASSKGSQPFRNSFLQKLVAVYKEEPYGLPRIIMDPLPLFEEEVKQGTTTE